MLLNYLLLLLLLLLKLLLSCSARMLVKNEAMCGFHVADQLPPRGASVKALSTHRGRTVWAVTYNIQLLAESIRFFLSGSPTKQYLLNLSHRNAVYNSTVVSIRVLDIWVMWVSVRTRVLKKYQRKVRMI